MVQYIVVELSKAEVSRLGALHHLSGNLEVLVRGPLEEMFTSLGMEVSALESE